MVDLSRKDEYTEGSGRREHGPADRFARGAGRLRLLTKEQNLSAMSAGSAIPVGKRAPGESPSQTVQPKRREYDMALQVIERVIEKHERTLWETLAEGRKGSVFPWRCKLHDVPTPGSPPPQPPRSVLP